MRKAVRETGFLFQNPPHFTGLDNARVDAAARLAGRTVMPVPAGALKAGKGSQAIHLWRAGPDGPLFLEKITATQSEFAAFRHLVGRDVAHLPAVLGAFSYRFRYHLFMAVVDGVPFDVRSPDFSILPLVDASYDFSQSLGSATQSLTGIETQLYPLIQTQWVRNLLKDNGVSLPRLDRALATSCTLPSYLIHNDLHGSNVMHDAQTGQNWLIDLGMLMVSHAGAELHPFAWIAANRPDDAHHFEQGIEYLATRTAHPAATLRQSCLTHCIEVNMRRAINHKSASHFASVIALCNLLAD